MLHLPEFPLSSPVLVFAAAIAVFLFVPRLFERARIPGLIGLIVAGAAIGPNGLGILERDATIVLLGTVGLLYLMFLVGLELDLVEFGRHRRHSVTFGVLSFLLPQVAGTGISLALGYSVAASILLGAMFASHTLVAYPVVSRLGILRTGAVTTVLGATLLTDLLAMLVLAVVVGGVEGALGTGFWLRLGAILAAYVAATLLLVPRLSRWFFRRAGGDGVTDYVFVLVVLFGSAALAELGGIEPIIGALLVGFAMNRLIPEKSPLMNRIKFTADAIFVPFFLLSVGMLVDVRALSDPSAWTAIAALVVGTVGSKALAAGVTRRRFGFDRDDGRVMFGLSVSHAAATMAITVVGYEAGLFDVTIVNAIVVVILVTCLVGPWVVARAGRRLALRESRRPYEPRDAPERILIPLANPATSDALLDLAVALRRPDSDEPVHPLMVVGPAGAGSAEAEVAAAERLLGHAVKRAVEAEVPVVPLTRVDPNVGSGILRAIAETRSSMVVVGWDGGRAGAGQWMFGSVLDRVLARSGQQVVVARLGHPLHTTRRLVLVLPPRIDRLPGYYHALAGVKRLAARLGASLTATAVGGEVEEIERHLAHVRPALSADVVAVTDWTGLFAHLARSARSDDLVVLLGARRGTLPWQPQLERLPGQLGTATESFLVLFPPREATGPARRQDEVDPRRLADPGEIAAVHLGSVTFGTAIHRMLRAAVSDPLVARRLRRTLVASEREFSNEIRPGVLLPHARLAGLEAPFVVLGFSDEGIAAPGASGPIHLFVLLVSPAERPEAHLNRLAAVARFLRSPEGLAELLARHGASAGWIDPS